MLEISRYIRQGANAYLRRQYRTIVIIGVIIAAVLALVIDLPNWIGGHFSIVFIAYLVGIACSLFSGYIAMYTSTMANVRSANKVMEEGMIGGLKVAFDGGLILGLLIVSLSLLAVVIMLLVIAPFVSNISGIETSIIGLAFGASTAALFAQLGGGIYTKAADVGADIVGKFEAGIPEDDPRNPAVIADNVGDNVGDIAGRGADLFESITGETIATMVLAVLLFTFVPMPYKIYAFLFPMVARSAGLIATMVSKLFVRGRNEEEPWNVLVKPLYITTIIMAGFFALLCGLMFQGTIAWFFYCAALTGLLASVLIGFVTLYYTDMRFRPVKSISKSCETGPATGIIAGISVGLESTALPVIIIAGTLLGAFYLGYVGANGSGSFTTPINGGIFATALATMGMLSVCGIVLTLDGYGPITDNAGGIAEMAKLDESVRNETDRLDAVGNTTKAYTKGYAIGSAALAAVLLFEAYYQLATSANGALDFGLQTPHIIIGLFIGLALVFLFSGLAMRAVGATAADMITEIRRQFRDTPGLKEGEEGVMPDYARCVDISTRSALRHMVAPGVLVVVTPIAVGIILGAMGVGGLLMGATVGGVLMALFMNNSGAAMDNGKYLSKRKLDSTRPESREAYHASIAGDTVGDPMKDTAGPSIHILIKLVGTISLQFATIFALFFLLHLG